MKSCFKRVEPSTLPFGISSGTSPTIVNFGRVEFREYPYDLGDNPSVSAGVPVTLGWDVQSEYGFEVETYEKICPGRSNRLGNKMCPRLDVTRRAQILLDSGYSMVDIVECTMEVLAIQRRRADSIRNRKWDGLNKFLELTKRKFTKRPSPPRRRSSIVGTLSVPQSSSTTTTTAKRTSISSPPVRKPPRRRGSLTGTFVSTPSSADKVRPQDLGERVLENQGRKRRTGRARRRASLDFVPLQPNFSCAMTA